MTGIAKGLDTQGGRSPRRSRSYKAFLWFASVALFVLSMLGSVFAEQPGKTLIVVAHPDDEYYCASTVYKMAVQLGGTVDELIITDGEGGYRYSTLAAAYYKKPLTSEAVGRKELPAIRRREAINAGKVLGIRTHYFLDQIDQHFTTDERDGAKYCWKSDLISSRLQTLMRKERYRYVFALLPRATSHTIRQPLLWLVPQSGLCRSLSDQSCLDSIQIRHASYHRRQSCFNRHGIRTTGLHLTELPNLVFAMPCRTRSLSIG